MDTPNNILNNDFSFVFTDDKSTGLYNFIVDDIYHSSYGAQSEAEEKFIKPLNFRRNFETNKKINVLDICYGIGYNTKAFLRKIIDTKYKGKIYIDALEYDKRLVLISPFIVDNYIKNYPEISYTLLSSLFDDLKSNTEAVNSILFDPKNKKYITPIYRRFMPCILHRSSTNIPYLKNNSFLHNIYYHCISTRSKKRAKRFNNRNIIFDAHYDDARKSIIDTKKIYDIVFLDAFTPTKLPTLWSLDFFMQLYKITAKNSLIVTYSNSAAVRHAMFDAGFYVGKIFDKRNRPSGTIASKNKNLIEHKLDDFDLGLMKTNAGIYFRDANLNSPAEEILAEWSTRKNNLKLQSSSQYIKNYKKEHFNEKL